MKIFKRLLFFILVIVISITATGCCEKPEPEIKIVTKYKKVYYPVYKKLKLNKPVPCDFSGTGFQPTIGLMECVSIQKKLIKEAYDFNTTDTNTTLDTISQ